MTVKDYNRSVDEFSDSVYRFILANIKDEDRAADVVQESYEKLWMCVSDIEYGVVKSWLFTTAYHTMIDIIRKEKRMTSLEEADPGDYLYEQEASDLNAVLHKALERLPENQKTVILLRDYEGYSYREIAEITGYTEAQVKINIHRGRNALRNFIGKLETVI